MTELHLGDGVDAADPDSGEGLFPEPARLGARPAQPRPAEDATCSSEPLAYLTRAAITAGRGSTRWHISRNGYAACGGYNLAHDNGTPPIQRARVAPLPRRRMRTSLGRPGVTASLIARVP